MPRSESQISRLDPRVERGGVLGEVLGLREQLQVRQSVELGHVQAHARFVNVPISSIAHRERRHAEAVLAHLGGDRRRTAAVLEISPSTLKRRLRGSTSPRVCGIALWAASDQ